MKTERRAGYAADRSRIESFSGVIVGKEKKHCLMASSNTDARLVLCRIFDWLSLIGSRSCEVRLQPRALNARSSSSINVNNGGINSGKCRSR